MRAFEAPVRVGHEHAVLEADVDVLRFGTDPAEIARPTVDRHVEADDPPAKSNALDGIGDGAFHDHAKALGRRANRRRKGLEKDLDRKGVDHASTMPHIPDETCRVLCVRHWLS